MRAFAIYAGEVVVVLALLTLILFEIRRRHFVSGGVRTDRKISTIWNEGGKEYKAENVTTLNAAKKKATEPKIPETVIETKNVQETAKEVVEKTSVGKIEGMLKGMRVTFDADIELYDKIGNDYAYFLRDGRDEIIGFSKQMIEKKRATISGTTDYFMEEHTAVIIDNVS